MNWYKHRQAGYKYKFSSLGNKYEAMSKYITNQLMIKIKTGNRDPIKIKSDEVFQVSNDDFGIIYSIKEANLDIAKINIQGDYFYKINYIKISITIDSKYAKNIDGKLIVDSSLYSELYFDILSTVRHEIEHLNQEKKNWSNPDSVYQKQNYKDVRNSTYDILWDLKEYFSQQIEKEAFVAGLYLKSKKMKKSFKEVLKEYIYSSFSNYMDTYKGSKGYFESNYGKIEPYLEEIVNNMYNYASERYHFSDNKGRQYLNNGEK